MSLLAPLFLIGVMGIGLPIFFHLIRRTTRERKVFSSLMFLVASPPRLTQRSRLENLLLLLLRCAVICLLAIGFARPFFKQAMNVPTGSGGTRVLVLVDTSASMRRANLWSDARNQVDTILRQVHPTDQVSLFTFDRQLQSLFTFQDWSATPPGERSARISQKLAQVSPGWGATQLGGALVQAAETLADSQEKGKDLHGRIELVTDLQEGSRLEQIQGYEWPKGLDVAVHVVKPRSGDNASLQLVSGTEDSSPGPAETVRVRVTNAAGSKREQFKVGWAVTDKLEFAEQPLDVYVPAGQSRVVAVPAPARLHDCILLRGDEDEYDNLVFARAPEAVRLSVLYLGEESEANPKQGLYFLKHALLETRRQTVGITVRAPGELLPAREAQASSLVVVVAGLAKETCAALRTLAAAGKSILIIPAGSAMQTTLRQLLDLETLQCEEVRPGNYAMLGEIDFRHAIFAPFADPRFSDFTKIHFWRYARFDAEKIPRARILARFDNLDPALVEVPTGTGRILILSSGWQPESSQLALSSKFVPLIYSILESSGAPVPPPAQYRIGDIVPLGALEGAAGSKAVLHLPDGSQEELPESQTNFSRTSVPGVYTVATAAGSNSFAVNLDPAESRTAPIPLDELEHLGVPMLQPSETQPGITERKTRLQNAEQENRQKLWRWVMFGTMGVLLLESWLAGRTARRMSPPAAFVPG